MKLSHLVAVIVVLVLLFFLLVPSLARARGGHARLDCRTNLRQLGTYAVMYACKYGSDESYPPAPGHGFLDTLFRVPTPETAIASGRDDVASCTVVWCRTGRSSFDYREPRVRIVDGLTNPMQPIACDRPTNHDPSGQDDINVLLFSGSVATATYGSPEWTTAMKYTK